MRLQRRNFAWLTVLGAMVAIAVLSGIGGAAVSATLLAIYLGTVGATVLDFHPDQIVDRSRSSMAMMRMSNEAREAVDRAKRRGGLSDSGLTLLDIGLITAQSNSQGTTMRRTRNVSLDDDGVRPFITLHVQPDDADRTVRIRFEIADSTGSVHYVHEMQPYLHEGEMNILADHQLPLADHSADFQSGDWDLRVLVDGNLIGDHTFSLAPSYDNRAQRFPELDRQIRLQDQQNQQEEAPLSLEDLLRSRSNRQQ
ncbi:MAG TPA: hypothetical protein VHD90_00445 [Phototrophicaceae bacterium]|nr:hypothetical protein [Phototrophicaceae bacterium]